MTETVIEINESDGIPLFIGPSTTEMLAQGEEYRSDINETDISDIPIKREEPWTDEIEQLVRRWAHQMNSLSELHDNAGYITKSRFMRLAIPSVIVPFAMGFISQVTPDTKRSSIVDGFMFMLTSGISGLSALFNYGQRYEQHFSYSSNYSNISSRIESELSRKRKYRIPAEIFITELKCTINNLNDQAPELPMGCC